MSMLKYAYDLGYQQAVKEAQLTPEQMRAAQVASGIGGGLAGAAGGGLLGKYLGGRVGEAFDLDEEKSKLVGMGLGGLLGGGAGAVAGSQLPRAITRTEQAKAEQEAAMPTQLDQSDSALGALPIAYSDYDPYADYGYYY